jgi:hypothetical protein
MYRSDVKHLLSALSKRADMMEPLVVKLALTSAQYPGDMAKYIETLEMCAPNLLLMERTVSTKKAFGGKGNPNSPGAFDVEVSEKTCMNKREGRPYEGGLKCPYLHEGMTGKICTDIEYLDKGICSQFKGTCKDKHLWNEATHGPKACATAIATMSHAAKRAYLHYVNMVMSPCANVTLGVILKEVVAKPEDSDDQGIVIEELNVDMESQHSYMASCASAPFPRRFMMWTKRPSCSC